MKKIFIEQTNAFFVKILDTMYESVYLLHDVFDLHIVTLMPRVRSVKLTISKKTVKLQNDILLRMKDITNGIIIL